MSPRSPVILIVDDKANMLRLMSKVLKKDGIIRTADCGAEALRILASERVDVVLSDLCMPDMDGLDVLRACKRLQAQAEFVLMTAFASVGTAVEALKLGAFDYIAKPFEPEEARSVVLRASRRASTDTESANVQTEHALLPGLIGRSQPMVELAQMVRKISSSELATVILGETGTGKERVARSLHEQSPRKNKRFIAINCAAIPAELLESELFGHEKGAFSGAIANKKGLFEEAHGGSLFLDEVGDMLPSLQAKLTRVLEERTIRRIGANEERSIDARVIAATHRDLEAMVLSQTFREDLWYRLNGATIRVPALRHRPGDIKLLAEHFLAQQAERSSGNCPRRFEEIALEALNRFRWPGNVRQLRSAVERACAVASGDSVKVTDLPPEVFGGRQNHDDDCEFASLTWAEATELGRLQVAQRYLRAVLTIHGGQVSEAAVHAGVERESFYRLLRRHSLDPGMFRADVSGEMGA